MEHSTFQGFAWKSSLEPREKDLGSLSSTVQSNLIQWKIPFIVNRNLQCGLMLGVQVLNHTDILGLELLSLELSQHREQMI